MVPRRPCRRRRNDAFLWEVQRHRLQLIAAGRLEPACERESFFLRARQQDRRIDPHQFIVPALLFLAEARAREAGPLPLPEPHRLGGHLRPPVVARLVGPGLRGEGQFAGDAAHGQGQR